MERITRGRRGLLAASVLVVGGLVAAGCGGDNKGSAAGTPTTAAAATASAASASTRATTAAGGTAGTSAAPAGLAKAQALVASVEDRPTKLALPGPVGKPIPTGKTIYQVTCGAEACDAESGIIKQATDILGWTLKSLHTDGSPQQIQNAWEQIVREKPDGVIYTATPRSQIDTYIKQAAANGTKIATCCIVETATDGIIWTTSTLAQATELSKVMAAWPIVDAAKS